MADLRGYVEGLINFNSEGTNVVPNPTGTPTDDLISIQIGDVIYSINGGGESIVPTPTNVDRSKYLGVKSDANELEYRAIRELPNSDGVKTGYVLTHTVSGDVWLAPATELPAYSTVQNNKVLGVHNGVLEWIEQSGGGGVNYSTEEQEIGTWIDGRTIYKKTWVFSEGVSINSRSWADTPISTSESGIDTIISCEGISDAGAIWDFLGVTTDNATTEYVRLLNVRYDAGIVIKYLTLCYIKSQL